MVDPDAGKAVSGRDVIEEVLNSGVGSVKAEVLQNKYQVPTDVTSLDGIQPILDDIKADGGGVIEFVPNSTYDNTGTVKEIKIPSNCIVEGNGAWIQGDGNQDNSDVLVRNDDWTNGDSNIIVRDLNVDAGFDPSGNVRSPYQASITFKRVSRFTFENVRSERGNRHCTDFRNCTRGVFRDCEFVDAAGDDSHSLSDISQNLGTSVSQHMHHIGCTFSPPPSGGGGQGVEVEDGPSNIYFTSCDFLGTDTKGLTIKTHNDFQPPTNIHFSDCYFEGGINILARGTQTTNRVRNIYFDGGEIDGPSNIEGAQHVRFSDMRISPYIGSTSDTMSFKQNASQLDVPCEDIQFDNVHFDGEADQILRPESVTGFRFNGCRFDATTSYYIEVRPGAGHSVSDVRFKDTNIAAAGENFALLSPADGTAKMSNWRFAGCDIDAKYLFLTQGDINSYSDFIFHDNDIDVSSALVAYLGNNNVRQAIITRDNKNYDDYIAYVPNTTDTGAWYLDDGTNTGSGTRGKRVYDGAAWADAWTL